MADPVSGKPEKNLPQARHLIDMLEVLQQKTEGNRTPEETEDIEAMLYQLRMAYVQVAEESKLTKSTASGHRAFACGAWIRGEKRPRPARGGKWAALRAPENPSLVTCNPYRVTRRD